MRASFTMFIAALLTLNLTAATGPNPIRGFSNVEAQEKLELQLDRMIERKNLEPWMQRLSANPHHLGSAAGKKNAEWIASMFRSWGYDTKIEQFDVLFPTPRERRLTLLTPSPIEASLEEKQLKEDPTSSQTADGLPLYNAYSIDGDVTGEVVYVNYGIPRDYDELERRGIDVKGKIVIARYGGSWRGIKPKVAAERGAIGCIIYSDPRDDGYFQGGVYPAGPFRNEQGAQRGSVADMPTHPGDPLTPGVGAVPGAKRLTRAEARTITKIPVLPISYGDALPILRTLAGPTAPESWRGALPITYRLGPGPSKVRLKLAFDWKTVPAYNVIARLQGSERPDQWIIRGNHHDAWVFGADDPISGLVAMMEEARAVAALAKSGARPKRTIIYAAWDGEEQGLLGSTEWVETHAEELKKKAAVYINTDSTGRGFFNAGGSHTLERFVNEVARDVIDPQKKISVQQRARAKRILDSKGDERKEARDRSDLRISALGSGSDFTPFLQHLGVASLNIGFGGEDDGGSYHSNYDSFDFYRRFGDPGFAYGETLAKVGGRMVLRLANADVLPFEFSAFSDTVGRYAIEVEKLADEMRTEAEDVSRMLAEKTYDAVADPTETLLPPRKLSAVPHLNFAPLRNSISRLKLASAAYEREYAGSASAASNWKELETLLIQSERELTRKEGLTNRPWYQHYIYAPGFYTGYGVKTLPSVREAIEQREWKEAEKQIVVTAGTIDQFSDLLEKATKLIARE